MSEELSFWLRRASKHFSAWSHIRNDASLRTDLRTLADPKMPGEGDLFFQPEKDLKGQRLKVSVLYDN